MRSQDHRLDVAIRFATLQMRKIVSTFDNCQLQLASKPFERGKLGRSLVVWLNRRAQTFLECQMLELEPLYSLSE